MIHGRAKFACHSLGFEKTDRKTDYISDSLYILKEYLRAEFLPQGEEFKIDRSLLATVRFNLSVK